MIKTLHLSKKNEQILNVLSIVVILMSIIASSIGLFWQDDGESFYIENVHGERVKIFGKGLYSTENAFKAPINKGTDAVTLFVAIPAFLITLILLNKSHSLRLRMLHGGLLSYFLYYSVSIGFGISYNSLYLVYLILFSSSLYAFIVSLVSINLKDITSKISSRMPHKAIAVFLIFTGLSTFVWLIEIINSMVNGEPLTNLGISTTEPTFILDLGIIAPAALIASVSMFKRKALGYLISPVILTLNSLIGVVVIFQTIFQRMYGVEITIIQFITFVGIFVVMSLVAMVLNVRFLKSINNND